MRRTTADVLHHLAPGRVRLLVAADVPAAMAAVREGVAEAGGPLRVVSDYRERLPELNAVIDAEVANLAEIALALWPSWYGDAVRLDGDEPPELLWDRLMAEGPDLSDRLRRDVSPSWFRAAARRCRAGRVPVVSDFLAAVQARQLALVIEPRNLAIVLGVGPAESHPGRLLGLARCAEWLARETAARVLVAVPKSVAGSSELDSISFDALDWDVPGPPLPEPPDEQANRVWPILGRPHPYSPGEQLLAERLAADPSLAGLFEHNVRVRTTRGTPYLVDLLYAAGKVVVEVDGYGFHTSRSAFSADRNRDYELIISGYLVLRLPHAEVMDDVAIAVEKIRDVVAYRRSNDTPQDHRP